MSGRIPQSFIDDVLARTDIVELIDRRVKLKRTGKNYSARCPFHEEKTPSFSVNPEKQFYYCFGCGAGGNALGFLMDYEKLEFPVAVEQLAAPLGMQIPRDERVSAAQEAAQSKLRGLYPVMETAMAFYRRQLREHPQSAHAVDYLKSRGLTGRIARDFDLGFAPPGWDNLLKALGEEQREMMLEAGLLVQNADGRVYDRFRDRIMFPIRDQRGRVIAFGGRVLGDDKPKYLNSPETPIYSKGRELYGLYQARRTSRQLSRIVVVEGYMDVIALAQHGVTNAVATLGTATTQEHLLRLFRSTPELVFCFDGDAAGKQAAWRALEAALPVLEDGRQLRFLFLSEGDDPDTWVRRLGAEAFERELRNATPLEHYFFTQLSTDLDIQSLDGKARMASRALPLLGQLPDGVYRELMHDALAERTGLRRDQLQMPRSSAPNSAPAASDSSESAGLLRAPSTARARRAVKATVGGSLSLTQSAIALLLHYPELAAQVDKALIPEGEELELGLLRDMLHLLHRRPESSTAALLGYWYGSAQGELLNRLAGEERLLPKSGLKNQLLDLLKALQRAPALREIDERIDKLRIRDYLELSNDEKTELMNLLRERQRLRDAKAGQQSPI